MDFRTNEAEFNRELQAAINRLGPAAKDFHVMLTLDAFQRIVRKTPVDTGALAGRWNVTANAPSDADNGRRHAAGFGRDPSADAIAEANAAAAQVEPYGVTYIQNPLPYAERIEGGTWSQRAPNGMVGITIQELLPVVREAKL